MQIQPFVSVLMPIRNEASFIARSLGSVLAQDYPYDRMEVIVADGMSDDETRSIVRRQAVSDRRVVMIDNEAQIMAAGFNRAFSCSRGDVIIMLGGHTELSKDYVQNCVRFLQSTNVDCVGGPIESVCKTKRAAAISLAMSSYFGVGGVAFRTGTTKEKFVDTVAFGAYKRGVIELAGPLDEELVRNQDDEFNYRLRKLGARLLLVPAIRSRYYCRTCITRLWRQYFQYGYWKVRVLQKHWEQMRPRQFVPPVFVFFMLGAFLLAPFSSLGLSLLLIMTGAYVFANSIASFLLVSKAGLQCLPLLSLSFAVLHISYGLGFLMGLFGFRKRWFG